MSRSLTLDSSLDTLKKEAKRWLKALRAGEADARRRLLAATPDAPDEPALRDVQFALAREHGLEGWAALRQALEDLALGRRSHAERVEIVLRSAWQGDLAAATRILARWPETAGDSLYTAVATGDLAQVTRRLAANPAAAGRKGGPLDWEPLLYLAYARLPEGERDAVEIARLLLDHGADPNARFDDGWGNSFTVLTGVIGEGEGDKPPHPQAHALATLLIERGANPFDTQALYNTSITRDDTSWVDFLWAQTDSHGLLAKWREMPTPLLIGGKVPTSPIDYLLGNAVAYNHLKRAEWLLTHGADPNGPHAYSGRRLREEALVYGHTAMAELLVRFGAGMPPLEGQVAFQAACMALDRETAKALAAAQPEVLRDAETMLTAARTGKTEVVSLLLELGSDVDVADETEQRGLHNAVLGNAMDVVRLLVAHGADVDRPTTRFGGAMGFASEFRRREIAEFLAPLSRDVTELVYLGMTERLGQLFAEDPALVNAMHPKYGTTALFALPDDEDAAAEIADFLLRHGADPAIRNAVGQTPEEAARKRGLIDAADLIRGGGHADG